jgi:hypothetical protein
MIRLLLAAAAAFALSFAPAAFADCAHCKDCPMHKMAQADGKGAKDAKPETKVACPCGGPEAKGECKCKEGCHCPHCHAKTEKQEKKS